MTIRILSVLLISAGCAPTASIDILSALEIDPSCLASDPRTNSFLFDIGSEPAAANDFVVALDAELNVTNTDETYGLLVVETLSFFTLRDGELQSPDIPRSSDTARRREQGNDFSSSDGSSTQAGPFFVEVTSDDAVALQSEPDIVTALATPSDRLMLDLHIQASGVAASLEATDRATQIPAESSIFVASIALCAGCLVPTCVEGETLVDEACFRGLDRPSVCELP